MLGKSLNEFIMVVSHTFRSVDNIESTRIISARKATKREQKTYQNRYPK
jgi:uncharacterized DUF497 family protein